MTTDAPQASPVRKRARVLPHATSSGMLLAAAAAPLGFVYDTAGSLFAAPNWVQACAIGVTTLLLVASSAIIRWPRLGRVAATLGILGAAALGWPYLAVAPLAALVVLIVGTMVLALLWGVGAPLISLAPVRPRPVDEGQAHGAALMSLVLWLLWTFTGVARPLADTLVVGWALGVSTLLCIEWGLRNLRRYRVRAGGVLAAVVGAALLASALWGQWWWVMSSFAGVAVAAVVLVRPPARLEMEQASWWEPLLGHPERLFVGTFAALCLLGTLLLALPQSAASGESIGFEDAIFTATSAVCVTGLAVLDTPVDFSPLGQFLILLLIQVGGLGIMTFSTAALWALGKRMSLLHEGAVASLISTQDRGRLFATTKRILQLTVITEGVGALVLAVAFIGAGDSVGQGLWRGLFTSISAFCNAGFSLQSDSLIPYQHSPLILHVIGVLIIVGGLSPLAVFAVPAIVRRSAQPISAQARLALAASAVLLVAGFLLFLSFEWNASLAGMSVTDRLHNAWFQSVTLRTAGFNSVDLTIIRPATLTLTLPWMFIGGSPGGTAGGVKTTTIAVLLLSVVRAIRGQWTLEVFGKRVPERTLTKAAVTVAVAVTTGVIALLAIQLTQRMSARLAVFEVVSALGTVGLTIGGTAELDGLGKALISVCMFVGRVGGVTLLMFLSNRRAPAPMGRPEEEIDVG
ncbi:potassium transporter TrkG [Haliangium sp.]|uniref:potassium transporter TrkG n=1 Tax=Haliangium sp. TaxID=2663208 RepID=UPI003D0B50CE